MNTTLKKKRHGLIGMESLLLAAVSSLRPLHVTEDGPPAKKTVCFIKRGEGGDQELDSGGPGVQITDGKKASMSGTKEGGIYSGHAGASGTKEGGGIVRDKASGIRIGRGHAGASAEQTTEIGRYVRSKQVGIDGTAPLALLHGVSKAQFGGARF